MKRLFKVLLTGVIFLCSVTSMYSQTRDWYWRTVAENTNFNNIFNWTDSPTGEGGDYPLSPMTQLDNVYFNSESNIKNITVSGTTGANMANLTVGAPGYSFDVATYNIAGSIDVHGTTTFGSSVRIQLINSDTNPCDATINFGGSFGGDLTITKPNQKVTLESQIGRAHV